MQRLDSQPDATLSSVIDDSSDAVDHHLSRRIDITIRRRSIHKDEQVRSDCGSFVDGAQVIFDPALALYFG
jgi:hypothetical protein